MSRPIHPIPFRARRTKRRAASPATRRGVSALLTGALLTLFLLPARASDPETELEKLIGKAVAYSLRDASGIDDDPLLLSWVRRVGGKVSAVSPRKNIPYTFEILGSDVANAVAAPGGHIFVTRGMLDSVESDDELAGILAHETGHVAKKHALQQIEGNLIFIALINTTLRDPKYDGLKFGASIANVFRTLHKSREMERQADDEGIQFSYEAGYDPDGLVRFLDGLGRDNRKLLEEYIATHPSPEARVENAKKFAIVNRSDKAAVEKIAQGYQARGFPGVARTLRNGGDPFALPPLPSGPPSNLTPLQQVDREEITKRDEATRRGLVKTWRAQSLGDSLQSLMLINSNSDFRWVYLASRAFSVETNVSDIYARTVRVSRTAPPTFDALVRSEQQNPTDDQTRINATLGRGETRRAMEKMDGVPTPIGRAANTAAVVLADLNNRFYRPKGAAAWTRYATLEAMLRYAESELRRADKESGQAWRLLSLARIRRYELRLNALAPPNDAARRALWYDLARRRLGRDFDPSGDAGSATIRAALALETGKTEAETEKGRGVSPWADWVVEKRGVPENIATVLRLLSLDMERETLARESLPPAAPVFPAAPSERPNEKL